MGKDTSWQLLLWLYDVKYLVRLLSEHWNVRAKVNIEISTFDESVVSVTCLINAFQYIHAQYSIRLVKFNIDFFPIHSKQMVSKINITKSCSEYGVRSSNLQLKLIFEIQKHYICLFVGEVNTFEIRGCVSYVDASNSKPNKVILFLNIFSWQESVELNNINLNPFVTGVN